MLTKVKISSIIIASSLLFSGSVFAKDDVVSETTQEIVERAVKVAQQEIQIQVQDAVKFSTEMFVQEQKQALALELDFVALDENSQNLQTLTIVSNIND